MIAQSSHSELTWMLMSLEHLTSPGAHTEHWKVSGVKPFLPPAKFRCVPYANSVLGRRRWGKVSRVVSSTVPRSGLEDQDIVHAQLSTLCLQLYIFHALLPTGFMQQHILQAHFPTLCRHVHVLQDQFRLLFLKTPSTIFFHNNFSVPGAWAEKKPGVRIWKPTQPKVSLQPIPVCDVLIKATTVWTSLSNYTVTNTVHFNSVKNMALHMLLLFLSPVNNSCTVQWSHRQQAVNNELLSLLENRVLAPCLGSLAENAMESFSKPWKHKGKLWELSCLGGFL